MEQIYRRTSIPKYDFNNLLLFFRTTFPKNTSGGLLRNMGHIILIKKNFFNQKFFISSGHWTAVAIHWCSIEDLFSKTFQIPHENTCDGVLF